MQRDANLWPDPSIRIAAGHAMASMAGQKLHSWHECGKCQVTLVHVQRYRIETGRRGSVVAMTTRNKYGRYVSQYTSVYGYQSEGEDWPKQDISSLSVLRLGSC